MLALQAGAGNQAVQLLVQRKKGATAAAPAGSPAGGGAEKPAEPTMVEIGPITVKSGGSGAPPDEEALLKSAILIQGLISAARNTEGAVEEVRKHKDDAFHLDLAYRQRFGIDLRSDAIAKLGRKGNWDDLVRILAFLHTGRDDESYTKLGLAVIPDGTRDAEIARIIHPDVPIHTRQLTQAMYERAFRGIGRTANDTLPEHLQRAFTFGGEDMERAIILLSRNLTIADQLHLCTTARGGTDSTKAIEILQGEWARGPEAFRTLIDQWEQLIHRPGLADLPLHEAMTATILGELSSESKEIVEAMFTGFEAKNKLMGAVNTAEWEGSHAGSLVAGLAKDGSPTAAMFREGNAAMVGSLPGATNREVLATGMDDIDLKVAEATLTAATTGGITGMGTNNEQVMKSIDTMRTIWEKRIRLARMVGNETLVAQYTAQWALHQERIRDQLQGGVIAEMSDLNADLIEAKLRLQGPLRPVDEIFIAKERYQDATVLDLVTKEWIEGREDSLRDSAEEPPPAGEEQVRPPYKLEWAVPQSRPLYQPTYAMYAPGVEHWERGANRLELHLTGRWLTSASKDIDAASAFLQKLSPEARTSVIAKFLDKYVKLDPKAAQVEKSPEQRFCDYLGAELEFSVQQQDLINMIRGPADSLDDHLMRAEIRRAAGKGYFKTLDKALAATAGLWDKATGEDTQELEQESIRSLRDMAKQAQANPAELDVMLALSGKESLHDLGLMAYDEFKAHHDAARATRAAVVEALEQIIDVAGRSLLVVLFPPTLFGGLMAALGAFTTGMAVRETFQAADYKMFSVTNLALLLEEVATFGFDSLGFETAIQELLSSKAVGSLLRIKDSVRADQYAKLVQEVVKSSGSKLFEKTASNMLLGQSLPNGQELAARAVNMVMLGGLKAGTMQLTKVMHAFTPVSERITRNLASIVVNGPPAKAALTTVLIKELASILTDPNFGHMTGPEIMARLSRAGMASVASAVSVALAISRVQQVEAAEIRQVGARGPDTQRKIDALIHDDPVLAKPYAEYVGDQRAVNHPVLPPRLWVKVAGRELLPGEIESLLGDDSQFRSIAKEYVKRQTAAGQPVADVKDWLMPDQKIHTPVPVPDHELEARRKLPTALLWKSKMSETQLAAKGVYAELPDPEAVNARVNMDKAMSNIYKQLNDLEKGEKK